MKLLRTLAARGRTTLANSVRHHHSLHWLMRCFVVFQLGRGSGTGQEAFLPANTSTFVPGTKMFGLIGRNHIHA
jgi:hypothetical protein